MKKGSKAVPVEYWYPILKPKADGPAIPMSWEDMKRMIKSGAASQDDFFLGTKYFLVYNAEQVDGIPPLEKKTNMENIEADVVSQIASGMGVPIYYDGGDKAFYRPSQDAIHLPEKMFFHSQAELDATTLHELGHSTGHESRLNRNIKNIFGSESYAFEELVAEITSAFMSAYLPYDMPEVVEADHKAYVKGWIEAIKADPDVLIKAIKEAEKASDYMEEKGGLISALEYETRHPGFEFEAVPAEKEDPDIPKEKASVLGRLSAKESQVLSKDLGRGRGRGNEL